MLLPIGEHRREKEGSQGTGPRTTVHRIALPSPEREGLSLAGSAQLPFGIWRARTTVL